MVATCEITDPFLAVMGAGRSVSMSKRGTLVYFDRFEFDYTFWLGERPGVLMCASNPDSIENGFRISFAREEPLDKVACDFENVTVDDGNTLTGCDIYARYYRIAALLLKIQGKREQAAAIAKTAQELEAVEAHYRDTGTGFLGWSRHLPAPTEDNLYFADIKSGTILYPFL